MVGKRLRQDRGPCRVSQPWDISIASTPGGPVRLAGKATGEPSGGSQTFLSATVTLTSEEILELASSPKTLVAAPGADKVLVPMGVTGVARFVTTGYTVAADIVVRQPSPSNNLNFVCYQLALALTGYDNTDEFSFDWMPGSAAGPVGGYGDDLSAVANKPLQLKATGSNPTDGDGGLTLTVYYALIDLT